MDVARGGYSLKQAGDGNLLSARDPFHCPSPYVLRGKDSEAAGTVDWDGLFGALETTARSLEGGRPLLSMEEMEALRQQKEGTWKEE